MCWELCLYLVDENHGPSWKCCWALINKNSSYINESILSFISLHCDEILLGDVLDKSILIRDQSIPNVCFALFLSFEKKYFLSGRISININLFLLFKFIL
jgi:hypothetical protein